MINKIILITVLLVLITGCSTNKLIANHVAEYDSEDELMEALLLNVKESNRFALEGMYLSPEELPGVKFGYENLPSDDFLDLILSQDLSRAEITYDEFAPSADSYKYTIVYANGEGVYGQWFQGIHEKDSWHLVNIGNAQIILDEDNIIEKKKGWIYLSEKGILVHFLITGPVKVVDEPATPLEELDFTSYTVFLNDEEICTGTEVVGGMIECPLPAGEQVLVRIELEGEHPVTILKMKKIN